MSRAKKRCGIIILIIGAIAAGLSGHPEIVTAIASKIAVESLP